jgi:hypothetical protein
MGGAGQKTDQMKIGLVLEGMKDGPDQKVLEPLVKKLVRSPVEVTSRTLGNKKKLLGGCGAVSSELLDDKCDRILIIWDLWPAWDTESPCRKEDRDVALNSLKEAKVSLKKIRLLCIEQMLENWLLADARALESLVTEWMHPRRPKSFRVPAAAVYDTKPKTVLTKLFQEHGCQAYEDMAHAHKISSRWDTRSLDRLVRLPTFARFVGCLQ